MAGITIGKNSLIGASSIVTKNVPEGELWMGNPAKFIKKVEDITWDSNFAKKYGMEKPYPWKKYFKRDLYDK